MEKQKKKLTISGKPRKNFVSQQNFESKKKFFSNDKKFLKPTINFKGRKNYQMLEVTGLII